MGTTVSQMAIGMKSLHRLVETNLYAILKVSPSPVSRVCFQISATPMAITLRPTQSCDCRFCNGVHQRENISNGMRPAGADFRQMLRDLMTH